MKNIITLYKYMSCRYAESTIRKQELYMDDGTNYNDPFELMEIDSLTGVAYRITGLHMACFTGGFRKKLMWSHYADNHYGIGAAQAKRGTYCTAGGADSKRKAACRYVQAYLF